MLGELVETTAGKWITRPPSRCPNGHTPDPNQVLVGHVACLGHGGGGHTNWHCRTCDAVVYGPPMNTHCTALEVPGRDPGTGNQARAFSRLGQHLSQDVPVLRVAFEVEPVVLGLAEIQRPQPGE
jgi:hypothetical protein